MKTLVIYDSKFGNTKKVAEAIAAGAGRFGNVHLVTVAEAGPALAGQSDLVFVGGPTQRRSMSPGLAAFFESALVSTRFAGVFVAVFDTRYRGSTWIMGSSAGEASQLLIKAGAKLVSKPESFFMKGGGPIEKQVLEQGELDRAESWAQGVASSLARAAAAA